MLKTIVFFLLSNSITAAPYVCLIVKAFRKAEKPLKKFIFLCSLSPLAFVVINLFLSTDTERFSTHFLSAMLYLALFFIRENDTDFSDSYDELKLTVQRHKISVALFAVAAVRIILSGVRF